MARTRNLKPSFFTNETLAEVNPLGRLLFQGLWCHADREGRLEDRPRRLKAEILPYDECDMEALLSDLTVRGFILRYGGTDGKRYIQVLAFSKHQQPHVKEAASTIPPPDGHRTSTVQEPDENPTSRSLTLNPSMGYGEVGSENPPRGLCSAALVFKSRYPDTSNPTDDETLEAVWRRCVKGLPGEARINRELDAWKASGVWDDPRFIPSMETFISKAKYRSCPPPAPAAQIASNGTGWDGKTELKIDPEIARIKALEREYSAGAS